MKKNYSNIPHVAVDPFKQGYFKPGDIIGQEYEIKRMIGKGGYGIMYLVQRLKTGGICH